MSQSYIFFRRAYYMIMGIHLPINRVTRPMFCFLYRLHIILRELMISLCRFFYYEPLFRSQCDHVGQGFRMEQLPYIQGKGRIIIDDNVQFSGKPSITFSRAVVDELGVLRVGEGTFVGHACGFNIGKNISIGRNCLLSTGVHCYDLDGHPLDANSRRAGEPTPTECILPIEIGDDVWVGNGAIILKGVHVGDRAIVAARSVVTNDVPSGAIVAGNPARQIGSAT